MVNPGKKLKKMFLIFGITGAVYGGFRYLLPLVIPFLLAYGTALWLRPSVRYLERRLFFSFRGRTCHVPAAVIGGAELLFLGAALGALFLLGASHVFSQIRQFTSDLPGLLLWLDGKLTGILRGMEELFGFKDGFLVSFIQKAGTALKETAGRSAMSGIMNNSVSALKNVAEAAAFFIIYFAAVLLILQEMDELRERKSRSLFHRELSLAGRRLTAVSAAWLKAQAVLMAITAVLCTVVFFLMGNPYSFLAGIGIGILDALPFFGSGAVLIPWGLILLIRKNWARAAAILALYAACCTIREILEPKIMGNHMGLSPLETFISMYVGFRLFGLWGFLLGPVGLLIVEDLVDLYWKEEGKMD